MTHGVWHDLLHLSAAAVLVGGGGLFLVLAVIARRRGGLVTTGPDPAPTRADSEAISSVIVVATVLSLAAAAIHLAAAPAHIADTGLAGWGFVAIAAFQAAWALAWAIQPSRGFALAAIGLNGAVIAAWAWSRTAGLPLGALAGMPEPISTPDAAATLFEVLLVALLIARLTGFADRFPVDHGGPRRGEAGTALIVLVPLVGVLFLATTLAVGRALDHSHGPGSGHGDAEGDHAAGLSSGAGHQDQVAPNLALAGLPVRVGSPRWPSTAAPRIPTTSSTSCRARSGCTSPSRSGRPPTRPSSAMRCASATGRTSRHG